MWFTRVSLHNPVFAEILDGVLAGVRARGYSTMVVTGGSDPALEQTEIDKLLEFQIEGLLLVSHRLCPYVQRAAIVLTVHEELSHAEAAHALGCTEATVSWRVFAARSKLKRWLKSTDHE